MALSVWHIGPLGIPDTKAPYPPSLGDATPWVSIGVLPHTSGKRRSRLQHWGSWVIGHLIEHRDMSVKLGRGESNRVYGKTKTATAHARNATLCHHGPAHTIGA